VCGVGRGGGGRSGQRWRLGHLWLWMWFHPMWPSSGLAREWLVSVTQKYSENFYVLGSGVKGGQLSFQNCGEIVEIGIVFWSVH
jgi:hypothetical protein